MKLTSKEFFHCVSSRGEGLFEIHTVHAVLSFANKQRARDGNSPASPLWTLLNCFLRWTANRYKSTRITSNWIFKETPRIRSREVIFLNLRKCARYFRGDPPRAVVQLHLHARWITGSDYSNCRRVRGGKRFVGQPCARFSGIISTISTFLTLIALWVA